MKTIYVGLDPSITAFGFAVESDDKSISYTKEFKFEAAKISKLNDKGKMRDVVDKLARGKRHEKIAFEIIGCLRDVYGIHKMEIKFVFEHFIMQGVGRICDMAELAGYIKGALEWTDCLTLDNFSILEVPPKTLKEFTVGTGSAKKQDMRFWCNRKYGIDIPNDNECDAYCLIQLAKYLDDETVSEQDRATLRASCSGF